METAAELEAVPAGRTMRWAIFIFSVCFASIADAAIINSDHPTAGWSIDAYDPIRGGTFRAQDEVLQSFTVGILLQSDPHPINVFVLGTDVNGAPVGSRLWESGQFVSAIQTFTFTPNLTVTPNNFYFIGIQVIDPVPVQPNFTSVSFGVTYEPQWEIEGHVWNYWPDGTVFPITYADIASTIIMTSVPEPSTVILFGSAIPVLCIYLRRRCSS